jgi:hypothetical protein
MAGLHGSLHVYGSLLAFTHGRFEGGKVQLLHLFCRSDFLQRRLNLIGSPLSARALPSDSRVGSADASSASGAASCCSRSSGISSCGKAKSAVAASSSATGS